MIAPPSLLATIASVPPSLGMSIGLLIYNLLRIFPAVRGYGVAMNPLARSSYGHFIPSRSSGFANMTSLVLPPESFNNLFLGEISLPSPSRIPDMSHMFLSISSYGFSRSFSMAVSSPIIPRENMPSRRNEAISLTRVGRKTAPGMSLEVSLSRGPSSLRISLTALQSSDIRVLVGRPILIGSGEFIIMFCKNDI